MTTLTKPEGPEGAEAPPKEEKHGLGDAIFRNTALTGALLVIVFLAGVAIFLTVKGIPAFDAEAGEQLYGKDSLMGLVGPLLFGTVLAALIAMIIVTPLAIGLALVISHYAPRRLAKPVGFLVDLLAAVPSVIFGLWGLEVLAPKLSPFFQWLEDTMSWLPFFAGPVPSSGRTIFTGGLVLALMALPIVTAIMREIFAQTPRANEEAALALGATRWEMIRMAVLPYGRSGMVAALLLGLGRALGETMAVAMVLGASGATISFNLISADQSANTIAAFIANNYGNASGVKTNVLIFGGLALFVLTFAVNYVGRWIATRGQVKA